jgi:PPM family protein phosphatase
MKIIPGNAQHIGARESQQDAFGFSSFQDEAFQEHGGVMMVLCDGMGGLANGAAASTEAVNAMLAGYQRKQPLETIPDALSRVIHEAHRAVCEVSGEGGMAGTTVVAAVVWRDELYWGSLGDSRLYLCRGNGPAQQLTVDHNVGVMMKERMQRGESSRREAVTVRDQEALTAYLGAPTPLPPHVGPDGIRLEPGDRIVACSDGVYRGLVPEAIAEISLSADPMTAAEQMVQAVLHQQVPYQDNATVAMLEVVGSRGVFSARSPALLKRALPVTAAFGAGVLVTCLVFLVLMPWMSGPTSPAVTLPPAAVTQSLPARASDAYAPDPGSPGTAASGAAGGTTEPSEAKVNPPGAAGKPHPASRPATTGPSPSGSSTARDRGQSGMTPRTDPGAAQTTTPAPQQAPGQSGVAPVPIPSPSEGK